MRILLLICVPLKGFMSHHIASLTLLENLYVSDVRTVSKFLVVSYKSFKLYTALFTICLD